MSYEPATIATLRRALDEVIKDSRFRQRKSASALEIAEHLLAQAAVGERDLERLKASAFQKLISTAERIPEPRRLRPDCAWACHKFINNDGSRKHGQIKPENAGSIDR